MHEEREDGQSQAPGGNRSGTRDELGEVAEMRTFGVDVVEPELLVVLVTPLVLLRRHVCGEDSERQR